VSDEEVVSRQRADGFIINGVTYVKQDRLKAWFPDKSVRMALRKTGIFQTTRPDTSTVDKTIIGIKGKPRYYVLRVVAAGEITDSKRSARAFITPYGHVE
jgi:hypothetical protein